MTAVLARRLILPPGEVAELCARTGLLAPPGFAAPPTPVRTAGLVVDGAVPAPVAAGLTATCAPRVGVLVTSTIGDLAAAFGVRDELGGSLLRAGGSDVEMSAWPGLRLGKELMRSVPVIGSSARPELHLPLSDVAAHPELRAAVIGTLLATVVAPPRVVGQVTWLATRSGWLSLAPAEIRDAIRWVVVRPVEPVDLGAMVAPLIASALS